MFKTKLQQLCHKRRWTLPKYSARNDGPPHKPSFNATVFVNGVTFTSSDTFNSSKEAHNQAAMKAFHNFSSIPSGSSKPTNEYPIQKGKTPTNEYGSKVEVKASKPQESPVPAQPPVVITDTNRLSKNHLQNYARKNNLDPPVFTIKTEGLAHDIHYKATVVIDGKSFESPAFFNTIKEAEQAAAKIALRELPISVDLFQKDESCPSKSLLLELTQREGYSKPEYTTTELESGFPHMPTFFSTVEVEGLKFHGKASRSKKQADIDAAKIAYIALKECGLDMFAAFSSSIKENQAVQSTLESDIAKYKQILNSEDKLMDLEILPTDDVKANNGMHNESFPSPPNKKMKMSNMSSSSSPKSSRLSHTELSFPTISDSNMAMTSNTSSYLLCDRFKVYTSFPDIEFPEDTTLLPIDEDKWVAACLEFPSDEDFRFL